MTFTGSHVGQPERQRVGAGWLIDTKITQMRIRHISYLLTYKLQSSADADKIAESDQIWQPDAAVLPTILYDYRFSNLNLNFI